jgi:hypothetical protein
MVNYQEYQDKCDPEKIFKWLTRYVGHEHLGVDIKEVSLEKYLAVAPDIYVLASMLQSMLVIAAEQKQMGEYGVETEKPIKPWSELTEEEKISQVEVRKSYLAGLRRGRDMALVEMANRVTYAARGNLDRYRLENPEYDPELVVDEAALPEVD